MDVPGTALVMEEIEGSASSQTAFTWNKIVIPSDQDESEAIIPRNEEPAVKPAAQQPSNAGSFASSKVSESKYSTAPALAQASSSGLASSEEAPYRPRRFSSAQPRHAQSAKQFEAARYR